MADDEPEKGPEKRTLDEYEVLKRNLQKRLGKDEMTPEVAPQKLKLIELEETQSRKG